MILAKLSDMENMLTAFNSSPPNIQLNIDQLSDNNIHFYDIQIHPCGLPKINSHWSVSVCNQFLSLGEKRGLDLSSSAYPHVME